jgi:glutamine synthetase
MPSNTSPRSGALLDLDTLRQRVRSGEIDTIVTVFPDSYGRLMGKRVAARYFLDDCLDAGTHGCNYLLTVNMEMDPLEGFTLASWDQGYGDFALMPDPSTLRPIPWQRGAAMVLCDMRQHDRSPVAQAPRSILQKQVERLTSQQLTCNIASELEFFLFNANYHGAFASNYANIQPSSDYRIDYHTMQPARDEPIMHALRHHARAAPADAARGHRNRIDER